MKEASVEVSSKRSTIHDPRSTAPSAGVINIDKPADWTSHDVVAKIRSLLRRSGIERVGHTGTLDPMATGVLPICFGAATKLSSYFMNGDKEYAVTCRLGEETDTGDRTGKVIHSCEPPVFSNQALADALSSFVGIISQTPPIYSAIKVSGVPMYKMARKGIDVERVPRSITIKSIELERVDGHDLYLNVACSKGTYIRTLCADIGRKLGVFGVVDALRRLRCGPFEIDQSIPLDKFIQLYTVGGWEARIVSLEEAVAMLPSVAEKDGINNDDMQVGVIECQGGGAQKC